MSKYTRLTRLQVISDFSVPDSSIPRSALIAELNALTLPLAYNVRNIDGTVLDATGGATKYKIVAGAFGTGTMELRGNDANNNTVTSDGLVEFVLPPEYVSGTGITVRLNARSNGAGTITVRTVDIEAFKVATDGAAGSDLCTTNAQTITGTAANYDFVIDPTGLVAGDKLRFNVRSILTITDTTATRIILSNIQLRLASAKA